MAQYYQDDGVQSGSAVYYREGYSYHKNVVRVYDQRHRKVYLRCARRFTEDCRGTASLSIGPRGTMWTTGNNHSCEPDFTSHDRRQLVQEVLQSCRANTYECPRQLLNRVAARYPHEVAASVRLSGLRHAMRRARMEQYPNIPHSLAELADVLSNPQYADLSSTIDGTDNIYSATVGLPGARSTVFVSQRMLHFLRKTKNVFADATFLPTPVQQGGTQVYQIVTVVRNTVIPIVQAVMESKSYEAYRAILEHLQRLAPGFQPRRVAMDFETAHRNAWHDVFHCKVVGCYVHHIRACLKKLGTLGLVPLVRNNVKARKIVDAVFAIPLLPKRFLKKGLEVVIRYSRRQRRRLYRPMVPFFSYYIKTWFSGWFFKSLSVYGEPNRTNNACESAHRVLQLETGRSHPNIWTFMNALRRYEQGAYADVVAHRMGRNLGYGRRLSALRNDVAIQNFTQELLDGTISVKRFLFRCSWRITGVVNDYL